MSIGVAQWAPGQSADALLEQADRALLDAKRAARQLAYLDVQGGRPRGLQATRSDRNARLGLPTR